MKKIITAILAVAMIVSAAAISAFAVEPVTITASNVQVVAGSTEAKFTLELSNIPDCGVASAKVWAKVNGLTITAVKGELSGQNAVSQDVAAANDTKEGVLIFWVDGKNGNFDSKTGKMKTLLATYTVAIPEDAKVGDEYEIVLTKSSDPGDYIDFSEDLNDLDAVVVNGKITIVDSRPGDVNDDGKVNVRDIAMMMRAQAGWKQEGYNENNQDYNQDGKFNPRDIAQLMRDVASGKVS